MPFDLRGALAAGYTDDEIDAYLGSPNRQRLATEVPVPDFMLEQQPRPPIRVAPPPPASAQPATTFGTIPQPEIQLPAALDWVRRNLSQFARPVATSYTGGTPLSGMAPPMPDPDTLVRGWGQLTAPGSTPYERLGGGSSLFREGMLTAAPALFPALGRAPARTLAGLAYGMGTQAATEKTLEDAGVDPRAAAAASDVLGVFTGLPATRVGWESLPNLMRPRNLVPALREFGRSDLGEIIYEPSTGWTSTLRDLIEAKAPGKVQPEQLRGIAAQAPAGEVQWSNLTSLMEPQSTTRYVRPVDESSLLDILTTPQETVRETSIPKSRVLEQFQQPQIKEVLRTDPDVKFGEQRYPSLSLPGAQGTRELLLTLPEQKQRFESGHYPEHPNVFAHARFNDRVSPEGKKVLFLEELQSDWHQEGRKKGYRGAQMTEPEQQRFVELLNENDRLGYGRISEAMSAIKHHPDWVDRWDVPDPELVALGNRYRESALGIPRAPFSKDWHELLMKRMLREAADKGYDRLAWTTGEQQAQRYDLSKHISRVELRDYFSKYPASLTAFDKTGRAIHLVSDATPEKAAELMGKDLADRLYSAAPVPESAPGWGDISEANIRSLEGLELQTGGEGMKGFYDKILPDFARKYGKKFGATVSTGKITGPGGETYDVHSIDITPAMRESIRERGQPMFGTSLPAMTKSK